MGSKWLPPEQQKIRRKYKRTVIRRKQTIAVKEYINTVKAGGCSLCGYSKCLSAIEFHHVGEGKRFELSSVGSRSVEQIKREIGKCLIVCANCHREIHANEVGIVNMRRKEEDTQVNINFQ